MDQDIDMVMESATLEPGILTEEALAIPRTDAPSVTDESYPEGGLRAWLVVLGAWCAMASSTGLINTFGVFQAWLSQDKLVGSSASSIGWIFSIHAFIVYLAGAQVGKSRSNPSVLPVLICF